MARPRPPERVYTRPLVEKLGVKLGARVAIVESLDLSEIKAGIYHLSALPLKIAGGDAGPVRAILWRN